MLTKKEKRINDEINEQVNIINDAIVKLIEIEREYNVKLKYELDVKGFGFYVQVESEK